METKRVAEERTGNSCAVGRLVFGEGKMRTVMMLDVVVEKHDSLVGSHAFCIQALG